MLRARDGGGKEGMSGNAVIEGRKGRKDGGGQGYGEKIRDRR